MSFQTTTKLLAPELGLGWQTALNLSVEIQPIAYSANLSRDWNGKLVDMSDPMFRLYEIRISADDDMRPATLSQMWPGSTFSIVPPAEIGLVIPAGSSTAIFERTVHSARALTYDFTNVGFTISDQTVTLDTPATEPVRVYARLQYDVMVTEPWRSSYRESEALYSWSLVTEEVGGI